MDKTNRQNLFSTFEESDEEEDIKVEKEDFISTDITWVPGAYDTIRESSLSESTNQSPTRVPWSDVGILQALSDGEVITKGVQKSKKGSSVRRSLRLQGQSPRLPKRNND